MDDDKNQNKYKIDKQIESIEKRIDELLENIDIKELSTVEKMELAIKFQTQLVRFLTLRKASEQGMPEGREGALMTMWMKQLRGENVNG
ncbi:MAG TPA: hypothetical protein VGL94_08440 [Ktedonobacteraceae bacterium]|jgi:hypothetical protein